MNKQQQTIMNKQQPQQAQIATNNARKQSENALKKVKERNTSNIKQTKLNNAAGCSSISNYATNNNPSTNIGVNNGAGQSCTNQNTSDLNQQYRKVRANSCICSMKSSQINKLNQSGRVEENQFQNLESNRPSIELYHFVRDNIDKNILNEFDTFQDLQHTLSNDFKEHDLLINIKQLIEIHFIQSKAAEQEIKEKHESECDSYDKNLQRLEAQIRDHIRIQQELKLYLESSQIKCQEQEDQIKSAERRHAQQTDFLEKVCEQMQQQLEIKNQSIQDMKSSMHTLQSEVNLLREAIATKTVNNTTKYRMHQDIDYYSKQINNLTNLRSQTENSSSRKIKLNTPTHNQAETVSQIETDQSLLEDKENNMSQLKQMKIDDVSPEKKIQTIINQQKLQNSQQHQQQSSQSQNQQHQINQLNIVNQQPQINQPTQINKQHQTSSQHQTNQFYEKKQIVKSQQERIISGKCEEMTEQKNMREKKKDFMDNYSSSAHSQSQTGQRQFSTIQVQPHSSHMKQNRQHIVSQPEQKYYATADLYPKKSVAQAEPVNTFQERMLQASKKIKEYIKLQSTKDRTTNQNSSSNKQGLISKLKYFSMKNSRAPSITNQNNLIQYFYEKFEDKLERNPSERSNIKQKMKTLQQISDRRYSTINQKQDMCLTEQSEGEKRVTKPTKRNQRHNRSNSFNIGSQQQGSCSNQSEQKGKKGEIKFAKKQKNYLPINSTLSSHNNMSNSGIASNNYNLNQIGNLNTNSSNISNFVINNSFANWNKRRESAFNQSAVNNISFQLEGAQKIIMNNNYIDESSDSFENFIKDNFILTNNSTENLNTLEL